MNVLGSADAERFNPRASASTGAGRSFGIRYPSPFFDVAQQFLPQDVHQLHVWCRYYFLTNPIINVACSKMAEYPVTPIIFDTEDQELKKLYKSVEKQLGLRQFQVEVGLDYFAYGNAFISIFYPLVKYLICRGCGTWYEARNNRSLYKWKSMRFHLSCPSCKKQDHAEVRDIYVRSIRDIKLIRWNPENIELKHNEATGNTKYFYKLPRAILNDITIGDTDTIEQLPLEFLEAARRGKALRFSRDNLYHLKRPTIAQKDQGWGSPLIFPLLKDAFHMQVLRKANEAIAMEHVVPLRVVFPGQSTGGNDGPYQAYNLQNWKAKIEAELNIWKRDNNHIPVLPVNVGFQNWGGDSKALIQHQELRLLAEHMLAGAGIPVEFVFGGLSWSGSNTSLRALENMFLGYNLQRHGLIFDFIFGNIAAYMQWPVCSGRFDRFKMADDLQRSMYLFQLNQAQKISDRTLHEDIGLDTDTEIERLDQELKKQLTVQRKMQTATADIQGESLLRTTRYQAKATTLQAVAQADMQAQGLPVPGEQPQPAAGAAPPGGEAAPAEGVEGAEGQPADNEAGAVPGMPEGATAYQENAAAPQGSLPVAMAGLASPLVAGAGGMDLRAFAQRAVSFLNTLGPGPKQEELAKMQTANPMLYKLVVSLDQGAQGAQVNPLIAQKAPIPAGGSERAMGRTIG